ncbi:hypothetical protein K491DRAFT_684050 [Lophiostoma macrostomum CBS 122681]|uniref:Uncharacterized protein n=1 Tax=Lophiostoma macrostomum CBS 122681 TaxID=1314788 RepID=A0A6A6SRM4_9PLEO|nr:hypothetical protein K491DRAFT_684050 [Lophiostoma macrostomum CBS 122681]
MVYPLWSVLSVLLTLSLSTCSPLDRKSVVTEGNWKSSICSSTSKPIETNFVQASIIEQQEWNLCFDEKSFCQADRTCIPYGPSSITPFLTTTSVTASGSTRVATFIATYLTEYIILQSPTLITSTDCYALLYTFSVGELGQVWSSWGSCCICADAALPTPPPLPPAWTHSVLPSVPPEPATQRETTSKISGHELSTICVPSNPHQDPFVARRVFPSIRKNLFDRTPSRLFSNTGSDTDIHFAGIKPSTPSISTNQTASIRLSAITPSSGSTSRSSQQNNTAGIFSKSNVIGLSSSSSHTRSSATMTSSMSWGSHSNVGSRSSFYTEPVKSSLTGVSHTGNISASLLNVTSGSSRYTSRPSFSSNGESPSFQKTPKTYPTSVFVTSLSTQTPVPDNSSDTKPTTRPISTTKPGSSVTPSGTPSVSSSLASTTSLPNVPSGSSSNANSNTLPLSSPLLSAQLRSQLSPGPTSVVSVMPSVVTKESSVRLKSSVMTTTNGNTVSTTETWTPTSILDSSAPARSVLPIATTLSDGLVVTSPARKSLPGSAIASATLDPTGSEASSSQRSLQTKINDIIPIVEKWIDDPGNEDLRKKVEDELEDTSKWTSYFWSRLFRKNGDEDGACNNPNTFQDLFRRLECLIEQIEDIRRKIKHNIIDIVSEIEKLGKLADGDGVPKITSGPDPTSSRLSTLSITPGSSNRCSTQTGSSCFFECVQDTTLSCSTTCSTFTDCGVRNTATGTTPPPKMTPAPGVFVAEFMDESFTERVVMPQEDAHKLYDQVYNWIKSDH